jgi:hypothetical protein
MQNTKVPKRNKKLKLIVLVVFILLIAYLIYRLRPKTMTNISTPTNKQQASYDNLQPGESTLQDVEKTLGDPLSEQTSGAEKRLEFKSISEARNNEAIINDQKLEFFIEKVASNKTAEDITKQYGVTNNVLYGPDAYNGYYLYVYPDNGIAYIGNPITRDVIEIWYFSPLSLEDFKQKWAQDYKTEIQPKF